MECFSRYDVRKSGRITASEFCSALSDLGHSSATEEEASAVEDISMPPLAILFCTKKS